jgi:hypothetical protein
VCIIVHVNEKKIVSRERSRLRSVVAYKRASGRERKFSKFPYEYTKQTNKNKPSSFKRTNSKASSSRQFPIRTAELEYVLLLNVVVVSVVVVVIFVWCVCSAIAPSDDVQVFAGGGLTFRFEAKLRKI